MKEVHNQDTKDDPKKEPMNLHEACEEGERDAFVYPPSRDTANDPSIPPGDYTDDDDLDLDTTFILVRASQSLCLIVTFAFYTSLVLSRADDDDRKQSNIFCVLQTMESITVDAVTVLFILTGCADSHHYWSEDAKPLRVLYDVNAEVYPHLALVNLLLIPFGMMAQGLWSSPMTWAINLGSLLYLSPFMETQQQAHYRLFNESTSILMTLLLCRTAFPLVRLAIATTVRNFPERHEYVNMANIFFQITVSCVMTSVNMRDNHFYYSFRFLLTRFSEYTLGCVCYIYISRRTTRGRLPLGQASAPSATGRHVLFLHFLVWVSQIDQTQPTDDALCARIALGAPCMTHFDPGRLPRRPRRWLSEHLPIARLGLVYQYPVAALLAALMRLLRLGRVATLFAALSYLFAWFITSAANRHLTPRLVPVLDRILDAVQERIGRW
ncbi:hypothetical protein GUITHDRAFT_121711 [Guillardia theta CCMP2712]|uniref:Uncharacterized protein n=1 Tax=Guillardia theta (strain CCMP2712) TaxID=905079 RepID=L1I886_GUITC|nr:hypothetical protein GUITHDRAFT_121711 [Guillardia theta CCMP2712]EKX32119.1 hypothetical protein GUITHDRAFT_121711 [Guillardia theta CCMP2712]|eukprot:XP_005819099.1 hypothetical protein GUITHDRAFT_121711 [Guillardia theta CCMP2712]